MSALPDGSYLLSVAVGFNPSDASKADAFRRQFGLDTCVAASPRSRAERAEGTSPERQPAARLRSPEVKAQPARTRVVNEVLS
ncbi:MAG: hypothetical protein ACC628_24560 [Pirellulaceae bacterium]